MIVNLYILFILTICFFNIKANNNNQEIHKIISARLNNVKWTTVYVSLENIPQNEEYVYFSFDFNYHSSFYVNEEKDIANFLISYKFPSKEKPEYCCKLLRYAFTEKNLDEIRTYEDIKNVGWGSIHNRRTIIKEELNNEIKFYYSIIRSYKKANTLLLRLPTNGIKMGSLTVENILDFPYNKNKFRRNRLSKKWAN